MSVSLTEDAVVARTKTVTRRLGWRMLKEGDRLTLCRKVMGRRQADGTVEPLVRLAEVVVTTVIREPLSVITPSDVVAEGFPDFTPADFIRFFCATHKGCRYDTTVTRIEWRYLDDEQETSHG